MYEARTHKARRTFSNHGTAEKVSLITDRETDPEVVVCDIGLPVMDGYALAQA
jgi:CheY-like chemotaxis protein